MKTAKYKILVLSDLKEHSKSTLKSSVSLAKMIDGEIDILHVQKPMDIVKGDNQLSAMRHINEKQLKAEKKIQGLINFFSQDKEVKINYALTFGKVQDEIVKHIADVNPDIIVLGQRKQNTFKIIGDSITQAVVKSFEGVIMIASPNSTLDANQDLSLGMLNHSDNNFKGNFTESILCKSTKPLKAFKISRSSSKKVESMSGKKIIEYVFEQSDYAFKNLSNYLSKSKVDLLFIDRGSSTEESDLKQALNNINVSMLLTRSNYQTT